MVVYMMLHHNTNVTVRDIMGHGMTINIEIQGIRYYSASDIMKEVGVSRQTLWRWRQDGKIPIGHRFRDGRILFTASEVDAIRQYANRIDPIEQENVGQLALFSGKS
jgi:predicted DNA-binding transcriptional regulator AlpA